MRPFPHIVLIGPMGAGKSTLGAALAARLGLAFVDLDERIATAAGKSIPDIFAAEGEAGFRVRETRALAAALAGPACVLATGGGVVLAEANRDALRDGGLVVYLQVAADAQLRRVAGDRNRPLLAVDDPAARLAELQARREPLYRELARITLDTDTRPLAALVDELAAHLTAAQESHP